MIPEGLPMAAGLPAGIEAIGNRADRIKGHAFDRVRHEHTIEHRLTTDVIDKRVLREAGVFFCGAGVTPWRRAGLKVQSLPRSLYRRSSVGAPVRTGPDRLPRGQPAANCASAASACSTQRHY